MDFYDAQDFCSDNDASLLKIETAEDRDALMSFLIDTGNKNYDS